MNGEDFENSRAVTRAHATHVVAVGRASSRPSGIAAPQTSHTPYVPASSRASATLDRLQPLRRVACEGVDLRALERDRRALGVVLVVGVAVPRGVDDRAVLALERGEARDRGGAQRLEPSRGRAGLRSRSGRRGSR